jgi:hypothetical protein
LNKAAFLQASRCRLPLGCRSGFGLHCTRAELCHCEADPTVADLPRPLLQDTVRERLASCFFSQCPYIETQSFAETGSGQTEENTSRVTVFYRRRRKYKQLVSANVAPGARTYSVIHAAQVGAALEQIHYFAPNEFYDPATVCALMAGLLVRGERRFLVPLLDNPVIICRDRLGTEGQLS